MKKQTIAEVAAEIAATYFTKPKVRCRVCIAGKVKPKEIAIAEALRNTHRKSFPLIARYLADQGIVVRPQALNAHFYAGHMGHKDRHESRPGRSRD